MTGFYVYLLGEVFYYDEPPVKIIKQDLWTWVVDVENMLYLTDKWLPITTAPDQTIQPGKHYYLLANETQVYGGYTPTAWPITINLITHEWTQNIYKNS